MGKEFVTQALDISTRLSRAEVQKLPDPSTISE
jgi:hypothetical protein